MKRAVCRKLLALALPTVRDLNTGPSSPLGPSHLFLLNLSHLLPPPLRDA